MSNFPAALETVKINDFSYRIEEGGVRSLLFVGTQRALLVDTGFGNGGSLKKAVSEITDKPVTLVISHADPDHTGACHEFDAAYMHPSEMAGFDKNTPVYPLWEGDIIDLGGIAFEVILIPGHTPGSIALLDRANRVIITGDSVSDGPIFMFGDKRSLNAYMESLKKLRTLSSAFDFVYPAHGSFPLKPEQIEVCLRAAEKLSAGELCGTEPPMPVPAKMYRYEGAAFFFE